MKKYAVIFFLICLSVLMGGCGNGAELTQLINSDQFSRVTPDELITIMGEPESKDDWNYDSGVGTFPTTTYSYNSGDDEFLVIDNAVVRYSHYNKVTFNDTSDLFYMFGVETQEGMTLKADTDYAMRYGSVSDKVEDFWVLDIEPKEKTAGIIKITYDTSYFDD